jgi:hypothetical protein
MIPYLGKNLEEGVGEVGGGGGEWGREGDRRCPMENPTRLTSKAPLGLIGSMLLIPVTVYILLYIKCCYPATVYVVQHL